MPYRGFESFLPKIFLTRFKTYPNVAATSSLASDMETKQYPPQQSPPVIACMHEEGLQPYAQSYALID